MNYQCGNNERKGFYTALVFLSGIWLHNKPNKVSLLLINQRSALLFSCESSVFHCLKSFLFNFVPCQDQLSADMYSFVAKEIDYASYFQTVSTRSLQSGRRRQNIVIFHRGLSLTAVVLSWVADRSPGRVPQKVTGASSKRPAAD